MRFKLAQPWLVLSLWLALWLLPPATVAALSVEDGLVENLGALAFLVAAGFFLAAFFRSAHGESDPSLLGMRRNLFLLLLAMAFFFAAGEEISWGQRIFGWETPAAIADINAQDETTIHNLDIFQTGKSFSFWFNVFWVGFCVGVPLLNRWQPVSALFESIRMPVVPISMGVLLLVNYATFKLIATSYPSESEFRHDANELKETTFALVFVWVAWFLFQAENVVKRVGRTS